MDQPRNSDFTPFSFETMRRGTSFNRPPAVEMPHPEREAGMRLMRGPSNPHHRKLSQAAQRWFENLHAPLQPHNLARLYPRIANRLAQCWLDPKLRDLVFADLLDSRRRGRKGFPPAVHAELKALTSFPVNTVSTI